ncbi:GNAT family N-acetyltransferase [Stutzerimonas kirkiae]|uniref:Histone acetyltransferase n=1 Tax=Stutzerimonas kirkiae TaxID=2211392 RepID=A0A4Q9R1B8_9GAMM|nr:GNAT family N-acetyltransferase [Stutzerimonas kirkiae]TBU90675.1 histone acetyltransferase [Stutzerimonas kirkiae]TBV00187.1 histone acetyltransferase [Stutzerimonas kirkiae]TBV04800.1 histone acetyltransferase [Stutzerimonas kirkiae]TBV14090.1 histone acetyltransferase [Stutzerimonas kirkiae]
MCESDIPDVMSIQAECYPVDVLEEESVVRARLASQPGFGWVAEDRQGVCAYLFAYPSRVGKVTPLDGEFQQQVQADCLYLHDLAVHPRAAGRRIGPALVGHALEQARRLRLRYSALVSVQQSHDFWARQGYARHDRLEPQQLDNLASYRIPAIYMVRELLSTNNEHDNQ